MGKHKKTHKQEDKEETSNSEQEKPKLEEPITN